MVLFTLLIQGLSTKFVLKQLDLIGDQPLRQEYMELFARRIALRRVDDYLSKLDDSPEIQTEFYRYEKDLVTGQLDSIETQITTLQKEYPDLRTLDMETLREKLLDIEADTYAEFIRAGRLNKNLSPVLLEIFTE